MITTTVTTSSAEIQLIALFNLLIKTFSQCLDCFIWIAGNIGAIGTCIVFYQPVFRKSPSAMYFIASSFSQLFVFNFATFVRLIEYGYGVPVNSVSTWFCKIRYYIFYVSAACARYNIMFASADRYFCSSRNALRRQWSSSKTVIRLNIINTIVWLLFYIQVLITFNVGNGKCRIQVVSIMTYFSFYITAENGFFPIFPLLFFGLLTIRNIHQTKRRTTAAEPANESQSVQNDRVSRKETQLHKMLANQVILYLILNVPYPVYTVYRAFIGVSSFTGSRALIDTFTNNLLYDLVYLGYALTFPNFILTSDMFRQQLKQIIRTKILHRCRRRTAPAS